MIISAQLDSVKGCQIDKGGVIFPSASVKNSTGVIDAMGDCVKQKLVIRIMMPDIHCLLESLFRNNEGGRWVTCVGSPVPYSSTTSVSMALVNVLSMARVWLNFGCLCVSMAVLFPIS